METYAPAVMLVVLIKLNNLIILIFLIPSDTKF
jgi:hypothetical protein